MIHFYAADAAILATIQGGSLRRSRGSKASPLSSLDALNSGSEGWDEKAAKLIDETDFRKRRTDP
jgi:hypothetical protein